MLASFPGLETVWYGAPRPRPPTQLRSRSLASRADGARLQYVLEVQRDSDCTLNVTPTVRFEVQRDCTPTVSV